MCGCVRIFFKSNIPINTILGYMTVCLDYKKDCQTNTFSYTDQHTLDHWMVLLIFKNDYQIFEDTVIVDDVSLFSLQRQCGSLSGTPKHYEVA